MPRSSESDSGISPDQEFEDLSIVCIDCDYEFVWTSGEQVFFRDKGLENPPKRCKPCKKAKNSRIEAIKNPRSSNKHQKLEVSVECAECHAETTVPFYPSQGRPVFCRACYLSMHSDAQE